MNMLENKIPLGLLSKEDQNLFKATASKELEAYDGDVVGWENIGRGTLRSAKLYRLKLVKGEYYCVEMLGGATYVFRFCKTKGRDLYASIHMTKNGKAFWTSGRVCDIPLIQHIKPATENDIEALMAAFEKTIYPKNPLEGFPPIFICPCKGAAALQIDMKREVIKRTPQPDDEYVSYDMGDINGTIVCAKCNTKMTYNIETPKG